MSSSMINRYRREAEHIEALGNWTPLRRRARAPELDDPRVPAAPGAGGSRGASRTFGCWRTLRRSSEKCAGPTSTPGRIRTYDQRIRNPLLYPTELRAQSADCVWNQRLFRARTGGAASDAIQPQRFPPGYPRRRRNGCARRQREARRTLQAMVAASQAQKWPRQAASWWLNAHQRKAALLQQ